MEALGHLIEQEKETIRIKQEEVKPSIYVVNMINLCSKSKRIYKLV